MKRLSIFFLLFIIFISCETLTDPIVYDKSIEKIDKETELIEILIRNENYKEAEERITKNLTLYPNNQYLKELKAWLYLQLNKYEDSKKIFEELLDKNSKYPHAYTGLARIYRIQGDKEKALYYINIGISYLPTLSSLWLEKGILEFEEENYKKALADFNKAYTLNNQNIEAYFFKYLSMLLTGRELDEIKNYWETILEKKAAKPWFFDRHAYVLYKLGNIKLAVHVIENGIKNYPDNQYLLNNYSYYLLELYKTDKKPEILDNALENILKCIELETKSMLPEYLDTYFSILEEKNEKQKIESELNKYLLQYPNSELLLKWVNKIKTFQEK